MKRRRLSIVPAGALFAVRALGIALPLSLTGGADAPIE